MGYLVRRLRNWKGELEPVKGGCKQSPQQKLFVYEERTGTILEEKRRFKKQSDEKGDSQRPGSNLALNWEHGKKQPQKWRLGRDRLGRVPGKVVLSPGGNISGREFATETGRYTKEREKVIY